MKLSELAIDVEVAVEGRWETFVLGVEFKVARANNANYIEEQAVFIAAIKRGETESSDSGTDMVHTIASKTLLLDWRGLEDEEGNAIPYSVEMALVFLTDPQYADIASFVYGIAGNKELFRKAATMEMAGN